MNACVHTCKSLIWFFSESISFDLKFSIQLGYLGVYFYYRYGCNNIFFSDSWYLLWAQVGLAHWNTIRAAYTATAVERNRLASPLSTPPLLSSRRYLPALPTNTGDTKIDVIAFTKSINKSLLLESEWRGPYLQRQQTFFL